MTETRERTIEELAREALEVQNACNLSGIAHGFSRAMSDLRRIEPDKGTDYYNTHPVAVLWASKIEDLTRAESNFPQAYKWGREILAE